MELKSFKDFSKETKTLILKELGYGTDGIFVTDVSGNKIKDRYIKKGIEIDNMVIFPGSTIILDDNPLSIISYIEEFGDVF